MIQFALDTVAPVAVSSKSVSKPRKARRRPRGVPALLPPTWTNSLGVPDVHTQIRNLHDRVTISGGSMAKGNVVDASEAVERGDQARSVEEGPIKNSPSR